MNEIDLLDDKINKIETLTGYCGVLFILCVTALIGTLLSIWLPIWASLLLLAAIVFLLSGMSCSWYKDILISKRTALKMKKASEKHD